MAHRSNSHRISSLIKGAPLERLFYCLLSCLLLIQPLVAAPDTCGPGTPDRQVSIDYVIDGDTVILGDDTHLRLIGIDTPEIDHDDPGNTEPGAAMARRFLIDLLDGGTQLLVMDNERKDRHGRLLGHLFLTDGTPGGIAGTWPCR